MYLCLLLGVAAACDVTPEKIQTWKGTEKGPDKLTDAVGSSSVTPELRAQAVEALVELGLTANVAKALEGANAEERKSVVALAVPRLKLLAMGKDGQPTATERVQREAKDALFVLRPWAAPDVQAVIDETLLDWLMIDLAGRMSAGGQGGEKILEAAGARAGQKLSDMIAAPASSEASRLEGARELGRLGDAASRERAGAALVEKARHERTPTEGTLQEIGLVGGDHAVAYLTQLAEDSHGTEVTREKALLSLAQRGDPASLPAALRVAADSKAPGKIRDAGFQLAEKIGVPALGGLGKLLTSKEELVRWRTVEAMLSAGKAEAVEPVLEGIAPTASYAKDDVRSYVVHDMRGVGPTAVPHLKKELASQSPAARLCAVEALGELGTAADADAVAALAGDTTKLKGWKDAPTLGAEAKLVAGTLRQKK